MNTFIRVVEIWVPTPNQTLLVFGGGLFGAAPGFEATSQGLCFARGEGLPGQAWQEGRPVLLKRFEGTQFRRIAAAQAAGLTGGLAVPVFVRETLKAVMVFYVGEDASHAGAIELWHNRPRVTSDMTLVEGHYGSSGRAFEAVSRDTYLPRGAGLPGLAWQRDAAVFMEDIGREGRFLRTEGAASAGIKRGLGVPCPTQDEEVCVVSFLSAPGSPIARRIENWVPGGDGGLQRGFGFCETAGRAMAPGEPMGAEGGLVAQAWQGGMPALTGHLGLQPGPVGAAAAAGLNSLLAWPVVNDEGRVAEVVALYF